MDRETFDRLILEHLPMAERFAVRLTGSCAPAEELVQSALLRAHQNWNSFAGKCAFRTWLLQIIVNCFRDELRARQYQRQRIDPLSDDLPDRGQSGPIALAMSAELSQIVAQAISSLPLRQREVIVLHTYEQLSDSDISSVLGIAPQNVRTTLHLARQKLKETLQPYLSDQHARK